MESQLGGNKSRVMCANSSWQKRLLSPLPLPLSGIDTSTSKCATDKARRTHTHTEPVADPDTAREPPQGWAEEAKQVPKADFTVITIHTRSIFDCGKGEQGKCVLFVWQHLSDAHLRHSLNSDPSDNHQETFPAQAGDEQRTNPQTDTPTCQQNSFRAQPWVHGFLLVRFGSGIGWFGRVSSLPTM